MGSDAVAWAWGSEWSCIQPMGLWVEVCGRPHSSSQAYICPACCCWVRMMSSARLSNSASSVRSRMSTDISTAWEWWTPMSRAKPASTEPSPGNCGADTARRDPAMRPTTAASAMRTPTAPAIASRRGKSPLREADGGGMSGVSVMPACSGGGRAGAAVARRTGFGGLLALDVLREEGVHAGVVGLVYRELGAPRAEHDGRGQVLVGADEYVPLPLCGPVGQDLDLLAGEVSGVGDPHGAVLEGVDGVLVDHRLGVHATVLPHPVVVPTRRRGGRVVHSAGDVVGRGNLNELHALHRCAGCGLDRRLAPGLADEWHRDGGDQGEADHGHDPVNEELLPAFLPGLRRPQLRHLGGTFARLLPLVAHRVPLRCRAHLCPLRENTKRTTWEGGCTSRAARCGETWKT